MKETLLLLALALTVISNAQGQEITVNISQGSLRGKKVTSDVTGTQYYSFQGIPFTQPPVGELRFQAPREAPTWTGVRDATFERSMCLQFSGTETQGSEDCLYLSVYTPQLPSTLGKNLLPVMVWIHGGGFVGGSGTADKFHPEHIVKEGVIFVTMEYRVGVLGFFGLNNSRVSVNNGLKDQLAALKWVQANIEQFGGDKNQVTLAGESAGGACVGLQVISPATKGLFHRAISESGNGIDRWSYVEPSLAKERAFLFGQKLGFTGDNEDALVDFLKQVPGEKLVAAEDSGLTSEDLFRYNNIAFQPTKESVADAFLPDSPLNIMKSGEYQHVPFITGFNSAEGKQFKLDYLHNDTLWAELATHMEQFVPPELSLPLGSPESLSLANEIKQIYFGNDTPTVKNIEGLINAFSDAYFVSGVLRAANFRQRNGSSPVYVYQFSYVGALSESEVQNYNYPFRGAGHGDEMGYLFNTSNIYVADNSTEMLVLNEMTTMWTNFIKTGNPTQGMDIEWNPLTPAKKLYLNIDNVLSIENLDDLHAERFAFWNRIFARVDN